MSTLEGLATALQSVVGADHLLTAAAAYAVDGVRPSMVVSPADEAQVAAVMRLAAEHRATVFPRGGGSHMTLGHTPEQVDVVLSLRRLQQQLAHEPADMTTTVQAGMGLADLQQTLHAQRQLLALDPPAAATTTLGGIIATNMSGPRRLLYGSARDLVLGTAVITPDGKRTKAGGRVVKNVTGYDLNKLYIGSLGTLAVIVELTVKLHPLPPGELTIGLGFSEPADMLPMLQTLLQLPLRLNSLELLNAAATAWVRQTAELQMPDTAYVYMARVEGSQEVTRKQAQRLTEALHHLPPTGTLTVHHWQDDEQSRLWRAVAAFPAAVHATGPHGIVAKVSLRLSDLPTFCQAMQQAAAEVETSWPLLAHAGSGIAYLSIPGSDAASTQPAAILDHIRTLDTCVERLQARRVLERAPVEVKRHCQVWGAPGDDFALMHAIKAAFDPHNRLNPGRFIGGL
ncbi:putative FAD-linked oxidoreductase [Candidatus Entotheonellaceae bacterium PAL068K]